MVCVFVALDFVVMFLCVIIILICGACFVFVVVLVLLFTICGVLLLFNRCGLVCVIIGVFVRVCLGRIVVWLVCGCFLPF